MWSCLVFHRSARILLVIVVARKNTELYQQSVVRQNHEFVAFWAVVTLFVSDTSMDHLPPEIIWTILACYCSEYTVLTKYVCGTWNHIIRQWTCSPTPKQVGFDVLIVTFAARGHIAVLQWIRRFLRKFVDWDDVAAAAAKAGHEHIVRLCHDDYGVGQVNWIISSASKGGHGSIVRLCKEVYRADSVNSTMAYAASGGHEHIIRLYYDEYSATDVNGAIAMAAQNGQLAMVQLCKETYGADDMYRALVCATLGGHEAIVRLRIERYGASKNNATAMRYAVLSNYQDIIKLLQE